MGMDKDHNAFWSIRCVDDEDYEVMLYPDADGSGKVLECSMLQATTGLSCFKKLDAQR